MKKIKTFKELNESVANEKQYEFVVRFTNKNPSKAESNKFYKALEKAGFSFQDGEPNGDSRSETIITISGPPEKTFDIENVISKFGAVVGGEDSKDARVQMVRATKNFPDIKKKFGEKSTVVNNQLQIIITPKQDFPWRVVMKDGKFVVSQSFSERTYIKPVWYKKGEYPTLEEAFNRILK